MAWINPLYEAHQRKRFQRHDAQRFIRYDAHRFLNPAGIAEEKRAAQARADAAVAAEQEAFEQELLQIRRDLAALKLELALRRIFHKYSPDQPRVPKGNPDGGQWTGDAGKDGRDKPRVVSDEISAQRRGGPRGAGTLQQQARLVLAAARAREAVSRVQQLDPNWPPPRSVTSRDNRDDFDVMIRAKEAETREADARFLALSRAGHDAPYAMRDPPTTAEVLMPGGKMVGYRVLGAAPSVRTATPEEFENIRTELMGGARRIEPDARYDGVWYKRQDGSMSGLRLSADHGLTLDVTRSDHPMIPDGFRIHQR
jgi:hypothetical protein